MTPAPVAATPPRTAGPSVPAWAGVADGAGRVLVACLFLYSGLFDMAAHWPAAAEVVAARGLPAPHLLAGAAMVFEIVAPVLLFIPSMRAAATVALAAYCVATAILFHMDGSLGGPDVTDASFHFFKNLALAGALLTGLPRRRMSDGRAG